jgi:hypothetical protein
MWRASIFNCASGGAAADFEHAHVAIHAFDGQIFRISGRPEHLQAVAYHLYGGVAHEGLGHGGFVSVRAQSTVAHLK